MAARRQLRPAMDARDARALCCLVALAALPQWATAQDAPRRMSLSDFEHATERRNPGVRAAAHAVEAAEACLDEATISPFFQFTARAVTGLAPNAQGIPGFTPDSQVPTDQAWGPFISGSIQGAIPLYTFGKISAARDAARSGVTIAQLGGKRVRSQLRFDVRRAYFALQLALDTLQMISEGRGKLERAVQRVQDSIDAGESEVDEFDLYRLHAALAEVQARSAEAESVATSARAALRLLSGTQEEFAISDCATEVIAFEPGQAPVYQEQAEGHRPELGMLAAARDARRADVQAQRGRYFPDLVLALQASRTTTPGRTDQSDPFIPDTANISVLGAALVAEWELDLWGNASRVRGAESRLAQTEAQTGQVRDGVALEIAAAHASLLESRARVRAWETGHQQTRRWFIAAAQGYEVGAREPKDLIDALKAYFTARFSHLQAMHDHNVALAKLELSVGAPVAPPAAWDQTCDIPEDSEP